MIPFHDENPTKNFPLLTILLIGGNIFVFFWEFSYPGQTASLFLNYGLVPYELMQSPIQTYPNVFSAMFLHAGFLHLGGNMLYLWIFGDNVEHRFGSGAFLLFYLASGIAATFAQIALDPGTGSMVTLSFPVRDIAYWDDTSSAFVVEPIEYEVRVGAYTGDPAAATARFTVTP